MGFEALTEFFPPVQLGFGGLAGFVAGYAAKKLARITAILLGLALFALQILAHEGWITIHWDVVQHSAQQLWHGSGGPTLTDRLWGILTGNLPFGAAFAAGFAVGFKLG